MLDFAIHFVKQLLSTQDKLDEPVILFLDGHSSQRDVASLIYFMEIMCVPSPLAPTHLCGIYQTILAQIRECMPV